MLNHLARLKLLACLLLAGAAWSQPQTVLWYRSLDGDSIGQGQTVTAAAPEWNTVASPSDGKSVHFFSSSATGGSYFLDLAAPAGSDLVAGPYEEAARAPMRGSSPGLQLTGQGRGCNTIEGRFVVLEAEYATDGEVVRFAANFEQRCDDNSAPLFGEIRFNSEIPLGVAAPGPDSLPDPFALAAQGPVQAGSIAHSNSITVYGVNAPVPLAITGGEYSVNGGAFTAAAGSTQPLDRIVVRLRAPRTPGATAQATLNAGGRSATFSVASYLEGTPLTGLYYRSQPGEYVGDGLTRLHLAPVNQVIAGRNFSDGVDVELMGTGGTHFWLNLSAPGNVMLVAGAYENAARWPFNAPGQPGLDFAGDGRGCNLVAGRFVVHEAAYAPDGSVERFAADFEQRCEQTGAPLYGEVRVSSTVPFSALRAPAALSNLSTRGLALTGNDVLIGGFIIGGTSSKTVVVRARGPSLGSAGIPNALVNPTLRLVRSADQSTISTNDDWHAAPNVQEIVASGFAPSEPLEAAILATLEPGAYTAIVAPPANGIGAGVGIVEVFELDAPESPLMNISTRGLVRPGNDTMIAGFVITGSTPQTVVVRARGPSLFAAGIVDHLPNPQIRLVRSADQATLGFNDIWQAADNAAALIASGFAPSSFVEAAILITLQPGAYTAIVSDLVPTATGMAIVEVFQVP